MLFCCVLLYLFSIFSCSAVFISNIYPICCKTFNLSDPLKKNLLTRHTLLNFFFSNTSFSDAQHDYISCSCQLSVKECFWQKHMTNFFLTQMARWWIILAKHLNILYIWTIELIIIKIQVHHQDILYQVPWLLFLHQGLALIPGFLDLHTLLFTCQALRTVDPLFIVCWCPPWPTKILAH